MVEKLSKIANQNNVINKIIRETGKQNKLTFKIFVIRITRAIHLINNKIN